MIRSIAIVGLSLITIEIGLSVWHYRREQQALNSHTPFYSLETRSLSGIRISSSRGLLQLEPHPQLIYRNKPFQKNPYFSTNELGFRSPAISPQKNRKRILLLGGSTVFGTGLDKDEDSLGYQLQRLLPHFEVINAGVVGYASGQELTFLSTTGIFWKPDIVISIGGANDAFEIDRYKHKEDLGYSSFASQNRVLEEFSILKFSSFPIRILNLYRVLFSDSIQTITSRLSATRSIGLAVEPVVTTYTQNISRMQTLSQAFSAKFQCVFQPNRIPGLGAKQEELFFKNYNQFRFAANKGLKGVGIQCLDSNSNSPFRNFAKYLDAVHLTKEGITELAYMLKGQITE